MSAAPWPGARRRLATTSAVTVALFSTVGAAALAAQSHELLGTGTPALIAIGGVRNGFAGVALVWRYRWPWWVFLLALAGPAAGETDALALLVARVSVLIADDDQHNRRGIADIFEATDDLVLRSLAAGATSFISKDEPPAGFQRYVRAVAGDSAIVRPDELAALVRANGSAAPTAPSLDALSTREREVLTGVALGRTNAEIAAEVYLGETTVKTHVCSSYAKLGTRSRVLVAYAGWRAGIVPSGCGCARVAEGAPRRGGGISSRDEAYHGRAAQPAPGPAPGSRRPARGSSRLLRRQGDAGARRAGRARPRHRVHGRRGRADRQRVLAAR